MQTARVGYRKTIILNNTKFVFLVLAFACSLITIQLTTTSSVYADDATPAGDETQPPQEPPVETPPPLPLGPPIATSATLFKPADAILSWTSTGIDNVEDSYDIRVAGTPETNAGTQELTTPIRNDNGLVTATYNITSLADGIYYWQVRSCSVDLLCSAWSQVWTVTIDGTAPDIPTAEITSGLYDQTVVIAGKAEPSSAVTVTVADKICNAAGDVNGDWSCTFGTSFDYGDYSASVVSTDAAGNQSLAVTIDFTVNELFVAPPITVEDLPLVLTIIPMDTTPENKVEQTPLPVVADTISTAAVESTPVSKPAAILPLSTDGGIIQSSEDGWKIMGISWYLWLGGGVGVMSIWWAAGRPGLRWLQGFFSP